MPPKVPAVIVPVSVAEKFAAVSDHWNPRIAAELNGQYVKLVKFKGDFVWHHHENEDELFWVTAGRIEMGLRDAAGERWVPVEAGELIVIPRGVEHCPRAREEAQVVLFEPATTLNTGNVQNERTRERLERI